MGRRFRTTLAWLVAAAAPGTLSAAGADQRTAGGVTITLSGDASFLAALGDLADKADNEAQRRRFLMDASILLEAVAEDDGTGLRYGSIVELNVDELDVDKFFIFVEDGFGELRFGSDDSAAVSLNYMASVLAVGTGGLDGEVIDSTDLVFLTPTDSDGLRVVYYSPWVEGLQLGGAYTMTDDDFDQEIADGEDADHNDVVDLTVNYHGTPGDLDLSAALSGMLGRLNAGPGSRSIDGLIASALLEAPDVSVAGGLAYQEIGGARRNFYSFGASAELGPTELSLNWGQCYSCDDHENWNLVVGIETGLLAGVSGALELSYFDQDQGSDQGQGTIALWSTTLEY